ncbi:unnamed protein product [Parnassius mnemosyne]
MVWFVFVRCQATGDLYSALIVFSLAVASEIAVSKYAFILVNSGEVRNIVESYLACDNLPALSSRFTANLARTLKKIKTRALTFWFAIYANCFIYLLKPILMPGRHVMEDFFILYGLDPMFETPNYQVARFTLTGATIFLGHLTTNITAFHIMITGYTEAQLLALSDELIYLWEDIKKEHQGLPDDNRNKHYVLNKSLKKRLKEIIKRHIINIDLHKKVDQIFRGAIAVEFLLLVLALVAELLCGLKNTYMEVPFALVLVATDCWTGQRVVNACDVFENSVYDSKWENFDKSNMKTICLMYTMSQKTLTMSAGSVVTLNLACFMSINKFIYSTYTTLESALR